MIAYFLNAGGHNFRPNFWMVSDWEQAERNAFEVAGRQRGWNVALDGCLFHFGYTTLVSDF